MTLDFPDLPRSIELTVGDRTEIPLPSYAGSGNIWSAKFISGQGVCQVAVVLGYPPVASGLPAGGMTEPPPLVLVPERAVVSGLAPGEAIWRLVLGRPFNSFELTAAHDLEVTVLAD